MRQVISNFLKEYITNNNKLEILLSLLSKNDNVSLINSLSENISQLSNEDKSIIAKTYNFLYLEKNPSAESSIKEQDGLIHMLNVYATLLLNANPFQKDRLLLRLKDLNGKQQLAAINKDGPLLLSAGPGSGKTRVMTYKIAILIDAYGIPAENILAMTFTNKAANEMKSRIEKLCGSKAERLNVGTFHSICGRFLRHNIQLLQRQYNSNYIIVEGTEQLNLIKNALKELNYDPKLAGEAREFISACKNELKTPDTLENYAESLRFLEVYRKYQQSLEKNNYVDYDDMIMLTVEILQKFPNIRDKYQEIYKYIHVDEYQDTNHAQYVLANLLADKYENITVVGDGDQSIYRFRGADMRNILNFEKDYPQVISITLDTNYRSTKTIVSASSALIRKNKERFDKIITPYEGNAEGDLIQLHKFFDDKQESSYIAEQMKKLMEEQDYKYEDFMILYRQSSLSRSVEDAMRRYGLPYSIVGGVEFYDREEIKDLLAYLRLSVNLQDSIAFERIYNKPRRRIPDTVLHVIRDFSIAYNMSHFQSSLQINKINQAHYSGQVMPDKYKNYIISQNQFQALNSFLLLIRDFYKKSEQSTAYEALKYIIEKTDYKLFVRNENKKDLTKQLDKLSNVDELLAASIDYLNVFDVEKDRPLEFINFVTLMKENVSEKKTMDEITGLNKVTLNIKRKQDDVVEFFGVRGEKQSESYSFDLSYSVAQKVSHYIAEALSSARNNTNYHKEVSDFYVGFENQRVYMSYQSQYYFEFTTEQSQSILDHLTTIVDSKTIRLMTEHAAKGLECKVVFIVGVEQGISPHFLNIETNLEEERRLFYVGMTRAEELLYLTNCQQRFINGKAQYLPLSQFVKEIPSEYMVTIEHSKK